MTRAIRRVSQILFFGLFLYLVFITAYPLESRVPVDILLRLDPLVSLAAMVASRTIIPGMMLSIAIVILTILLGRAFCGWVCPLGTTLDAADKVFFRTSRRKGGANLRRIKYYVLAGLLVTAVFTTQAVYLLDPLSLLTRTVVLTFVAPLQMALRSLNDLFLGWSYSNSGGAAWVGTRLSDFLGSRAFVSSPQIYYRSGLVVLAVFTAIVALNSLSRRFWCRNLCPLGALLGLLSYVPLVKRAVGEECTDCARCVADCKMAAIHENQNPRLTRTTECIECFNCVEVCRPVAVAVSFRFRPRPELHRETRLDLSRRRVLQGAGIGLAFAAMVKIDPGRKEAIDASLPIKLSSPQLIRPPGSVPEDEFVARCSRCAECMKACPTNGLQPAIHEAGLEGFWTPILVPRIGSCTQECNLCGRVCPTDAIQPFEIEEKKHIFIGLALIDRSACIAWYADRTCFVCDEFCSYNAIEWKTVDGLKRPFVNEKKCVGCGICEENCPIQPLAAIRVYSYGDKRHMSRKEQRAWAEG